MKKIIISALLVFLFLTGCNGDTEKEEREIIDRLTKIPETSIKVIPETDIYPPVLHSIDYETPVPVPGEINTAGAEDSPFIMPDGNTFYFFFTPDPNIPPEKQLIDQVTGIYVSKNVDGEWSTPARVYLQDIGKDSLDGCEFVQGNVMWFCSARASGYRDIDFYTAEWLDGEWKNWQNAGERLNKEFGIGEMHLTAEGLEIYFHSDRAGGAGQYDIWVSRKSNDIWGEPENISAVNTGEMEDWPFITQDGNELWFTRVYQGSPAIFRSTKVAGNWTTPELIISRFAGEPTLDSQGNIYFVHHFYKDGIMIEADIYVAYRK